ncbi:MAG: GlsB/YeaQ/YmgE family stress response membrane protein [Firmicutes bacterium]|nr:GlsB/YeaQ/YmgE family stress response membrane protein [Bacillota bacterium]
MGIVSWLVFGAIVGWIAGVITGKRRSMGLGMNIIVGILGSVVGGWLGNLIGVGGGAGFTKIGFVTSIVGACLLLIVFSRIGKNK